MRAGFMSSAVPLWDLPTILEHARADGFTAIEPRVEWGHQHGLERTAPGAWRAARQLFADADVVPSSVALGSRFNRPTAEERAATVAEVVAYAELSAQLGAPLLRVFGGPLAQGVSMESVRPAVAEALGEAAEKCASFGVTPCLETHDSFWNPADVAWCLEHARHQNLGAVWHAAHHIRHGISVDDAYATLGPWVRHVHLSEVPKGGATDNRGETVPIPLGEGDGSMRRQAEVLAAHGYQGALSLEWINRKDTPADPEPVLRQYGTTLKRWIAELTPTR